MADENDEIVKEVLDEIEEQGKKYPVRLTWKNLFAILGVSLTIIGGAFGTGIKVQLELSKIATAKVEQTWMDKLKQQELIEYEWKRKAKEYQESSIFFENQYHKQLTRLEECEKEIPYSKSTDSKVPQD